MGSQYPHKKRQPDPVTSTVVRRPEKDDLEVPYQQHVAINNKGKNNFGDLKTKNYIPLLKTL